MYNGEKEAFMNAKLKTKLEIPFKIIVQLSDLLAQLLEVLCFPMTSAVTESGRIASTVSTKRRNKAEQTPWQTGSMLH